MYDPDVFTIDSDDDRYYRVHNRETDRVYSIEPEGARRRARRRSVDTLYGNISANAFINPSIKLLKRYTRNINKLSLEEETNVIKDYDVFHQFASARMPKCNKTASILGPNVKPELLKFIRYYSRLKYEYDKFIKEIYNSTINDAIASSNGVNPFTFFGKHNIVANKAIRIMSLRRKYHNDYPDEANIYSNHIIDKLIVNFLRRYGYKSNTRDPILVNKRKPSKNNMRTIIHDIRRSEILGQIIVPDYYDALRNLRSLMRPTILDEYDTQLNTVVRSIVSSMSTEMSLDISDSFIYDLLVHKVRTVYNRRIDWEHFSKERIPLVDNYSLFKTKYVSRNTELLETVASEPSPLDERVAELCAIDVDDCNNLLLGTPYTYSELGFSIDSNTVITDELLGIGTVTPLLPVDYSHNLDDLVSSNDCETPASIVEKYVTSCAPITTAALNNELSFAILDNSKLICSGYDSQHSRATLCSTIINTLIARKEAEVLLSVLEAYKSWLTDNKMYHPYFTKKLDTLIKLFAKVPNKHASALNSLVDFDNNLETMNLDYELRR